MIQVCLTTLRKRHTTEVNGAVYQVCFITLFGNNK